MTIERVPTCTIGRGAYRGSRTRVRAVPKAEIKISRWPGGAAYRVSGRPARLVASHERRRTGDNHEEIAYPRRTSRLSRVRWNETRVPTVIAISTVVPAAPTRSPPKTPGLGSWLKQFITRTRLHDKHISLLRDIENTSTHTGIGIMAVREWFKFSRYGVHGRE